MEAISDIRSPVKVMVLERKGVRTLEEKETVVNRTAKDIVIDCASVFDPCRDVIVFGQPPICLDEYKRWGLFEKFLIGELRDGHYGYRRKYIGGIAMTGVATENTKDTTLTATVLVKKLGKDAQRESYSYEFENDFELVRNRLKVMLKP